ncbi:hypothetical protein [Haloechinothrix salitolerans]|uniref:Uncharacterized protein n=1 Tax=Haloechinothrix salitolerans TaxID=926830 RepID=A0ABW2C0C8_9PSEU
MQSTVQLVRRKAWLEAQHKKVCAELRARGVDVDEPKANPTSTPPTKPRAKRTKKKTTND